MLKFGTDGVRGVANVELTAELVLALGRSAARVLGPAPFLVGRDTRRSGPLLQAALTAGLTAEGVDVVDLGVLPTPAVAYASQERQLPAAVISASHNPYQDNGVKFFLAGGRKLPDDVEARLEKVLADGPEAGPATPEPVGTATSDPDAVTSWIAHILASCDRLSGLHIVLDCANGAATTAAPRALRALGMQVTVVNADPNGRNINAACGCTHPAGLQRAVVESGADAGLALDGDADRVLAVDHTGALVDGDQLLALFARDMHAAGTLHGDTVVITVMANSGLRVAMAGAGIAVHETPVGDRSVLEALEAGGWSLGGEQSGHLILRDLATTGDGTLTGALLLGLVRRRGKPLAELAAGAMTRLPQVLRSVTVAERAGLDDAASVWEEVAAVEASLAGRGRVLLRPSGTEPVVRVMVEAATPEEAGRAADRLVAAVAAALGRG